MSQVITQSQKPQKEKIDQELNTLVDFFQKAENVPEKIAKTYLTGMGKPSDKWSLNNKLIQLICGNTEDARTYNQWLQIGRHVKKGERSFFILAPNQYMIEKEDKLTGEKVKIPIIKGFRGIPVFADHQTEGKKIVYINEPKEKLPLLEVAEKMGLKVKYGTTIEGEYGSYNSLTDEIRLCTTDMGTFFHELAHAVQKRLDGSLKAGQDKDQEIIAEFTSCVIASIYGYDKKGYTFKYLAAYNNGDKTKIGESIIKVLSKVEKILNYIFSIQ